MAKGNGKSARVFETRSLAVKLTEQELLKRGEAMSEAELEIEKLKLDRVGLNNEIKVATKKRADLAHIIDAGEEPRDVKCEWAKDFAKNCMRLKRTDTGAEVETRALTASERTGDLFEEELVPMPAQHGGAIAPPPRKPRGRPKKNAAAVSGTMHDEPPSAA